MYVTPYGRWVFGKAPACRSGASFGVQATPFLAARPVLSATGRAQGPYRALRATGCAQARSSHVHKRTDGGQGRLTSPGVVGFRIDPDYWGRGLATEGGRAALEFGFNVLGLREIVSIYQPEDAASGRVMQRLGLVYERDTKHPALGVPLRVFKTDRDEWASS